MSRFAHRLSRVVRYEAEDITIPLMAAQSSDSLVETIGVSVHSTSAPYDSVSLAQWQADIAALGVRHVRMERVTTSNTRQTQLVNAMPPGTKLLAILDDRGTQSPSVSWAHIQANWQRTIVAVSGPNEPNIDASMPAGWPLSGTYDGTSNYMPVNEAQRQQALVWTAVSGGAATVACSPLAMRDQPAWFARYGIGMPRTPLPFQAGDIHMYQGGRRFQKNGNLGTLVDAFRTEFGPHLPVWLSETGYHNLIGTSDTHIGTSEEVAAIYAAEFPFACQAEGIDRAYFYELYNETSLSGREANFGLFHAPGTSKPIATVLGRILSLYSDPGAPHPSSALRVRITGGGSDFQSALHQKRDGRWLLAMWRRANLWDFPNMSPIAPPSPTITTVTLSRSRPVTGYTPTLSGGATSSRTTTSEWTVSMSQHMHVFEIER